MKYIYNISSEQINVIIDKIISFIKENKYYTVDGEKLEFVDGDVCYSIYKCLFKERVGTILVSNQSKGVSIVFNSGSVEDINKYNFINDNIFPLISQKNKTLDNSEFFEAFNISPDITIERGNKVTKILKKIFSINK